MDWKLFVARRIYRSDEGGKEVSKPAVRIAMAGIAVGLAVMLVSVSVVVGFKREVRQKVVGVSADVLVTSLEDVRSFQTTPIRADDSLVHSLAALPGVAHVQRFATKPGMIMTADNFQGMVLKGVGGEYDLSFLARHLQAGVLPVFSDSVAGNEVLVSRTIADRLALEVGDKLFTYYLEGTVRARRLTVAGIYQTHFAAFDDVFLFTDLFTVNRLNNREAGEVDGLELSVAAGMRPDSVGELLRERLAGPTDEEPDYYVRTVEEVYPQIFAWLDLLDLNVWVILLLMTGVAGFTMISGLLIVILERTTMIGVLKALGADNAAIRQVFLSFAVFVIGRGMVWGNVIGLALCGVQALFKVVRLDPATYYIDAVPVELNVWLILLLNVATLLVSVLMLIGPSCLVSHIHPAKSMRYE